jgi:hypothetical protein
MLIPGERPPPQRPRPEPPSDDPPESPAVILGMGLFALTAGTYGAVAGLDTEGAKAVLFVVLGLVLIGVSFFCFGWSWREFRRR